MKSTNMVFFLIFSFKTSLESKYVCVKIQNWLADSLSPRVDQRKLLGKKKSTAIRKDAGKDANSSFAFLERPFVYRSVIKQSRVRIGMKNP
jgi:hypothetical protein